MPTMLEQLLAKLAAEDGAGLPPPAPSMPIPIRTVPTPNLGMPIQGPQDVPQAPLDDSIIQRYLAAAGPAPVAPVQRRPGRLETIAAVLSGISEGPAYGMALREERRRPQREYERNLQDYQDRRANLQLRGINAAEADQERRTAQAQRLEDRRFDAEFARETRRLNLAEDEQRERLRQSYQLERDARADRRALEAELQRERRAQEQDAKVRTGRFFTASGDMALSTELGRYYAGLSDKPLSPAAVRLDRRIAAAHDERLRGATGGGGRRRTSNAAAEALQKFNLSQQAYAGALQRGDSKSAAAYKQAMDRNYRSLSRFPAEVEIGETIPGWPYAKLRNAAPAPAAQPQQQPLGDPLGIR